MATIVAASWVPAEQPVEPLRPEAEQQVEILHPRLPQTVQEIQLQPDQEVTAPEPVSPARRAASTVGKVVLGIVAAGVALGAAAASLLFF